MAGSKTVTASYVSYVSAFGNAQPSNSVNISDGVEYVVNARIPYYLSATQAVIILNGSSFNTNSSGALSVSLGIYSISGSTASLASSSSIAFTWTSGTGGASTASNFVGGVSSIRYRAINIGTWNITPGMYLLGLHMKTGNDGSWAVFAQGNNFSVAGVYNGAESGAGAVWLPGVLNALATFNTAMVASINVTDANYVRTNRTIEPVISLFGTF
jgi:hypothetical protein